MEKNESGLDRGMRAILAVILVLLGATVFTGTLSTVMYVLGAVMFVTAVTGFCALYRLLGINTNKGSK
jgi:hypothetical protein